MLEDFDGKIPLILDGGQSEIGIESTVVDLTGNTPTIVRPGQISKQDIEKVIGRTVMASKQHKIISPGMKYKHYAPEAKVFLAKTTKQSENIAKTCEGKTAFIGNVDIKTSEFIEIQEPRKMAKDIFRILRKLDRKKVENIIILMPEEKGIGIALRNRLEKAAYSGHNE